MFINLLHVSVTQRLFYQSFLIHITLFQDKVFHCMSIVCVLILLFILERNASLIMQCITEFHNY